MFPLLSHRYYEMEMTPEIEIEKKYILGKKRNLDKNIYQNQNHLTFPSVMGYRPFINVAAFSWGRADKSRDYKLLHDWDLHI